MSHRVASVQSFVLTLPRDDPYLGPLREGETVNAKGYFVRRSNRTVYPTFDRSVLVRVTSSDGAEGWGETYGLVAPAATTAIIDDLLGDFVVGRDPFDAAAIHDDLYDLMRVRGYTGGFYLDALAAVDIALWDLAGRLSQRPLADLLGGQRRTSIPAYVSGLPAATLSERVAIARRWCARGFDAVKFADGMAGSGPVAELAALRRALGAEVRIGVDLHWRYRAPEAIRVIREMEPYDPWFAEAPVAPEDVAAQAEVAHSVRTPIALGEEWRTAFDARLRLERGCPAIVQPEMGHTGPTEFLRIAALAHAKGDRGHAARHHRRGHLPGRQPARFRRHRVRGQPRVPALHSAPASRAAGRPARVCRWRLHAANGTRLGVRPGADARRMIGLSP